MEVFSQIIKKENFSHDLEALQSILKEKIDRKIIYIKIENKDSFLRAKKELSIIKQTEPDNSIVIMITEYPGSKWIKRFPRITDRFENLHFST